MRLKNFEKIIIEKLCKNFDEKSLHFLLNSDSFTYEFTEVGYFLTLNSKMIPVERMVIQDPKPYSSQDEIELGFLIFVENQNFTFECFSFTNEIPSNIRNLDLAINFDRI